MQFVRKNLLIITFDQARGDWCDHENSFVELPALKLLASRGYNFVRCYTRSPQCIPARLSWLTGKMPSNIGVTENIACNTKKTIPTLFKKLRRAGWYLKIIGKTHWTAHQEGKDLRDNIGLMNALGFDDVEEIGGPRALKAISCNLTDLWHQENYHKRYVKDMKERYSRGRTINTWTPKPTCLPNHLYPDIWIANEAIKTIKELPETQPWVLWVSFVGPHEPFDTPKDWKGIAEKNNIPKPESNTLWINDLDEKIELKKNLSKWSNTFTSESCSKFREDYANNIKLLDDQILKILNSGINHETTNIMVTSDHGEMLGDYNMLYKSTFLEPAIRVPMILSNLGNKADKGQTIKAVTDSTTTLKYVLRKLNEDEEGSYPIGNLTKKNKAIIEYRKERCFILGQNKLVTSFSGEILWKTIVQENSIKEDYVKDSIYDETSDWQDIRNWARRSNISLNKRSNQLIEHLEFL